LPVRRFQENNIKDFDKRINILKFVILLSFLAVLTRVFSLQYFTFDFLYNKSLDNKVKLIEKSALRGTIYDRNGTILARNTPSFDVAIIPSEIDYDDVKTLDAMADAFQREREDIIDDLKAVPYASGTKPVILRRGITRDQVAMIEENRDILKSVEIIVGEKRIYPSGLLAAQILGYTGFPSSDDIGSKERLSLNTFIGKSGIEKYYDNLLRGKDGWDAVLKDTYGRVKETSLYAGEEIEKLSVTPEPGKDIVLSIDERLQSFAEKLLEGKKGSAVVLDIRSGEVLAMASNPSFDPNIFVRGISRSEWDKLVKTEGNPFLNRGCSAAYPPGSIFKVVTAIAALEKGIINPSTRFTCKGSIIIGNRLFHCWNKAGHGSLNVKGAIRNSCNVFFYNVGKLLGSKALLEAANSFGIGKKTGIDYPFEENGRLPETKIAAGKGKTKDIRAPLLAIGQGDMTVTPLQASLIMATIATGGTMPVPRFSRNFPSQSVNVPISVRSVDVVRRALFDVVNSGGTGIHAKLDNVAVCGKTGTAQVASRSLSESYKERNMPVPEKFRDHAWFAGFAPYKNPEISFAVFIEHGGSGGASAAPVARELLNFYFKLDRNVVEKRMAKIKNQI